MMIPLLAGTLYGGMTAGLLLTAVAFLTHSIRMNMADAIPMALICLCIISSVGVAREAFFRIPRLSRFGIGTGWSLIAVLFFLLSSLITAKEWPGYEVGIYALLHTFLWWFVLGCCEQFREFQETRRETLRMEKLTANSSLAVIIAHELRNPLTTVHGFLQLIRRQNPSEQIQYYVNTAMQELNEAEKVIHTYLTITTLNQAQTEEVDLRRCVDAAVEEVQPLIDQKKIQFFSSIAPEVIIDCNPEQLQMCLSQLLRNGTNALHRNGKLSISAFPNGKELLITVTDNGVGMTEEELEQLGMPKYNTRSSGTGTGLMYCFHFIHSLRGRLRIQSRPGQGTTVMITLPTSRVG